MKVYISVDMEGIAGISHPDPTGRGDPGYAAATELMIGEANAAIEGAQDGGADEIVVNDSHGRMFNLPPAALHPAARLLQGQKAWSMVEGAQLGGFGVALFVGYHARAGDQRGTIAHTYSFSPTLTTLAGRPVGESGLNALALGAWGIPVGMVAGDDVVAAETADWLPWAEAVVVKRAVGRHAAESLHPTRARELIRAGARRAVERARAGEAAEVALRPLRLESPLEWRADFRHAAEADYAASFPGAVREGDRTVRYRSEDPLEAYRAFVAAIRLASLVE